MLKHIVFVFSITALIGCSQPVANEQPRMSHAVAELLKLEAVTSYQVPRAYIGKISTNQFTPVSFEYGGTLEALFVDDGDEVKKGQVLAQLNTQLLTIKLEELNAQLAQNKAQITLNSNNLARINELKKDNYASAQTFDELTAQQAILAANQQQLIANINALNYQINRSQLIAPFDGIISQRSVAQGANIQAGMPVFQLIKQNDQEVKVGVSSELASGLSIGQSVVVEISKTRHQGKVIRIGRQINNSNRTVNLRIALEQNVQTYNDQLARVYIDQTIHQVGYWVPMSALTDGVRGQWNLLIAKPKGENYQLSLTAVQVEYATEQQAFITGIEQDNALFVAQGVHKFVPNQMVTMRSTLLAEHK
ncbi:efflux RND transporter periplasmic adaptor subunit [Thalassotalea sp. LPB0316]|uniref:efflux RND transporter periplasmic adaptor subunit n=1 Tax=Thalassotalea sp. LPB0316 TaxID=2769490 RepID=UPI001867B928|nr:efflux RND transporter periplasmic adaptor subunit [Thalassotalea sp. LPB0316]QOL26802.1 efflux RND transporter periplasmic adaptor subunit [Thalassotalea sp. LPB0316]